MPASHVLTAPMAADGLTRHPLWPHQQAAFAAARPRRGFMLAIGMGGGKTAATIALLEDDIRTAEAARWETCEHCHGNWPMTGDGGGMDGGGNYHDPGCQHCDGQGAFPTGAAWHPYRVLVLCPKSVVGVWPDQIRQHATSIWHTWNGQVNGARGPLKNPSVTRRATALVEATKDASKLRRPLLAVVNYEAAHQGDLLKLLLGTPWDAVILDESHRIKKPGGKASKLAARVSERTRQRGGRVLALTGTPMPHSPLDLWAQIRALDGGQRLGTNYHHFCAKYGAGEQIFTPGGIQRTIFKDLRPDKLDQFTALVGPLMHQVTEAELDTRLGLPPYLDVTRSIELDAGSRRVYNELEKDAISRVGDGVVTAANAMVLVLRLAQAASGYAKDAETGQELKLTDQALPEKARLLADILEDLPLREPVVVFCRFHHDLNAVRAVAAQQGRRYGELSGRDRSGLTADSRMSDDVDVLGVQIQSGGVGIDLTRARFGVYYTLGFELADYLQSRKRLHRPGQTRPVTYVHLLAAGTVEHAIYGALNKRRQVVETVLTHLQGAK